VLLLAFSPPMKAGRDRIDLKLRLKNISDVLSTPFPPMVDVCSTAQSISSTRT